MPERSERRDGGSERRTDRSERRPGGSGKRPGRSERGVGRGEGEPERSESDAGGREIRTVGHSTRPIEGFVELLREHAIERLVDVRRFPMSRRNPQFSRPALERSLAEAAIEYVHEPDLGGRRSPRADSPNGAWRNPQFRGYADHMASAEFVSALAELLDRAGEKRTAVMCAEAHPSRCHRRLLADAIAARGWRVVHAIEVGRSEVHDLHPAARVEPDRTVVYPAAESRAAGQRELGFEG